MTSICSLGLAISTVMSTQASAMIFTAILTSISSVNYSGVVVPIASLSAAGQQVAHLFPCMYFTHIVEGVFLKGTGFAQLWPDLLDLVALFRGVSHHQLSAVP